MDATTAQRAFEADPFEPLRIRLASGGCCDVLHADSVFIHDQQLLIVSREHAGSRSITGHRFIDLQLVTDVVALRLASDEGGSNRPYAGEVLAPAAKLLDWSESLFALIAAALICALVGLSGVVAFLTSGKASATSDVITLGLWALLMSLETLLLIRVVRFYHLRLYPLPLVYALASQPRRALLGRLAFTAFWLAHALAGVLAFAWLDLFLTATNYGGQRTDRFLQSGVLLAFVWAGAHASMMFLLLAARSLGVTPLGVRRLWRWRVLLDLLIVGIAGLSPELLVRLLYPLRLLNQDLRFLQGR